MRNSNAGWMRMKFARTTLGMSLIAILAVRMSPHAAHAEPPCQLQWSDQFPAGTDGRFQAMIEFDDGSGPALIMGGGFSHILGMPAANIARKRPNGEWEAMGDDIPYEEQVYAFAVYDSGNGPELYVGGTFYSRATSVMKWTGREWVGVGAPEGVATSLAVFDDGSGPALYAGGGFVNIEPSSPNNHGIARWTGREWKVLPGGITSYVSCLQVFDDGRGPMLFAGGTFDAPGQSTTARIAAWNGRQWVGVGKGVDNAVECFAVVGGGPKASLLVGGHFLNAGSSPAARIARWDGESWNPLGSGLQSPPRCIAAAEGTHDPHILVGGRQLLGTDSNVVQWSNGTWTRFASEVPGIHLLNGSVAALRIEAVEPDMRVIVTGDFSSRFAKLAEGQWTMLGRGLGPSMVPGPSYGLKVVRHPVSGKEVLCAFGGFGSAGSRNAATIALWDGAAWEGLGTGIATYGTAPMHLWIGDVCSIDDELGPGLIVGGWFNRAGGIPVENVARWDGKQWTSMGSGFGKVWNLAEFDDGTGPAVFAGGSRLSQTAGEVVSFHKWQNDGWVDVPGPLSDAAQALTVLDDEGFPALFGASLVQVGQQQYVTTVHRWDGKFFEQIGGQFEGSIGTPRINSLAMFSPSIQTSPQLFAAGDFTQVDQTPVSYIAQWDGASWRPVGSGLNGEVRSLVTFDDGNGPALYAAGNFDLAGDVVVNSVAKWDGTSWSSLGDAFDGGDDGSSSRTVHDLATFDDGVGGNPSLYAIGKFSEVDGKHSSQIARWGRFAPPQPGDANGDCAVNVSDLLAIISSWGTANGIGDVNHDGTVNVSDLLLVISNWGASSGS